VRQGEHPRLDLVGDVRDHLHGSAQVVSAAFLLDDRVVDLSGRDVVLPPHGDVEEALVMADVQVGLGAVVGDVDLAVLVRAHRARIDVQVRIELLEGHGEAAALQ
jgi:hypothetical protein